MSTEADDPAFARPSVPGCFEQDGLTHREYLIAHAPSMPDWIVQAYRASLHINEPEALTLPWNEHTLKRFAVQEARWRGIYADAVLAEQERKEAANGSPPSSP